MVVMDDVCGEDRAAHDRNLKAVLQSIQESEAQPGEMSAVNLGQSKAYCRDATPQRRLPAETGAGYGNLPG